MKKACFLLLLISLVIGSSSLVYGGGVVVTDINKLDTSRQIKGHVVAYTLDVPAKWKKYVLLEQETDMAGDTILERIVFYYKPVTVSTTAQVLMELCVFNKDNWKEGQGYTKLAESDKYVLVYKTPEVNPFVFGSDRLIFDSFLKDIAKTGFLKDYISFPTDKDDYVKKTISVNGKRIALESYVTPLRAVYVPVREVCQELGYSVGWNSADSTITISSGSFYTTLGNENNTREKYIIININGKSYISTMFFLQVLKCGVEIDQYSNVRITKEAES